MAEIRSKVVIVGGGIIGPTLALLLKQKGYHPVIIEKVKDLGASGIAIAIHPNGLKVLNQAGVGQDLMPGTVPWKHWNEYTSEGDFLGGPASELMSEFIDKYGWPCVGFSRTKIQLTLRDVAIRKGIEFLPGWKLSKIHETENSVTVRAEDGREIEAAFVVGCDGLKSVTREIILDRKGADRKEPDFTGVAVIGGTAPSPPYLVETPGAHCWYGDRDCVISHPIDNGKSVWAINYPMKTAVSESWRTVPEEEIVAELKKLTEEFKDWPEPVRQLMQDTDRLMTIGLYDRPEMPAENWFDGRCMLLGDAAHPATPHIGQGANQGLEDCWVLTQTLPDYDDSLLSRKQLEDVFYKVASSRQPKTAELAKQARMQGELRVVTGGPEARKQRDTVIRQHWQNMGAIKAYYDQTYEKPFRDQGGYNRLQLDKSH